MKIAVLCAAILVAYSPLSAQKVDLDKYYFNCAGMYNLPNDPLPEDFKTFNVNPKIARTVRLTADDAADRIEINGWRRMAFDEKAHITIDVNFENLIISKTEITERKEDQKDKAGKIIGTKVFYRAVMQYNMTTSHSVKDYTGKVYKTNTFNNPSGSHTSDEYSSYAAASSYISINKESLKDKFTNELINKFSNNLSYDLTNKWGIRPVKGVNDHLWLMDSKKHTEQDSMQMMAKLMKEKFAEYREGTLVSEFQEMIAPFIGYLERLPARYKGDEKNDKKLRYSAYYNLAKLYWYMDNPDKSDKYADLLIKNDYDPGDGEDLKKNNTILRTIFQKSKINKRHLVFDTSTFVEPK